MTQSNRMRLVTLLSHSLPLIALLLWSPPLISDQPAGESYRVDTPHPRLLLTSRRQRLLKRERERQSLRWTQFDAHISTKAEMPEKGFALALYYVASGNETIGNQAVQWALGPGADLRQQALVYDWCQPLLTDRQSEALAAKIQRDLEESDRDTGVLAVRSRVLGAMALADRAPDITGRQLRSVIQDWWRRDMAPGLRDGGKAIPRQDLYAFFEMLHAIRDNLNIDLREDAAKYFTQLPLYHLLTYYPAVYPAAENEFRIPIMKPDTQPDLRQASLSRAADLSMVAYDPNAVEMGFLQGWAIQDQFLMRGPFGITYEFLWANPYHPGLSYFSAPLFLHDKLRGILLLRASWESGATWFYHAPGHMQIFEEGRIKELGLDTLDRAIALRDSIVVSAGKGSSLQVSQEDPVQYYVLGLKPSRKYDIEVDDEEIREEETDAGGILVLKFPAKRHAGVRWRPSPPALIQ